MDKILRIDMGAEGGPKARVTPLGDYAGLGGRGLTSAIVSGEVPPLSHPLSADNKLVFAPGLLSGSVAAMSGRISVGCKSPLTGGIKEANAGGQAAQTLARLGYAAIVLEARPKDDSLYEIFIDSEGVKITANTGLKMLGNYALIDNVKSRYGDKVACLSIGPAGEMKMSAASIACTDMEMRPTRHAGRGGVGAVMGSKGVKVIILDDSGTKVRTPKSPDAFKEANKRWVDGLKKHPVTGQGMAAYGTNILTNILNEAGGYPTRNFLAGRFSAHERISGETLAALEKERGGMPTHGCHRGCVIQCSGVFHDRHGNYLTKQPEYETVWAHGGNCGISDLDMIAQLDRLDDDYGLDTIEMGNAVAVAMEAGLAAFGDGEAAIRLVHEVGKGTPLGRILGNGAAATGRAFGIERVPVVKGQAMPAYDPRAVQGIGVTYATSTMGADHTAGYAVTSNILNIGGTVNPLKPEGQVDLSRKLQIATAAIDSIGMCIFVTFATMDQPETFQAMLDMVGAFSGINMTADCFAQLGQRVLANERNFNAQAGFTAAHDRLPTYFKAESLPPHEVTFQVKDTELDTLFNW